MWQQAGNGLVELEINDSFLKNKPVQLLEYLGVNWPPATALEEYVPQLVMSLTPPQ